MTDGHAHAEISPTERPVRFYRWPEEWGLWSSPLGGYHYEPSTDDPRIFEPVRLMTPEEIAAEEAAERLQDEVQRRRKKLKASAKPGVRTALYRLCDADGQLLYIGISDDPLRRWPEHAKDKAWWSEVASFSQEWHDDRLHALAAEAIAIRTERPLHNVAQNNGSPAG